LSTIEIKNLYFHYTDSEPVLKDINLVLDGRTTAIIGQNGAGKTTLVKLLKGLLRPVKGEVLLDGEDLASLTVAQISRKIGLVFQNPNDQIFKNKVIDEVLFGPLNIGMEKKEAMESCRYSLELVGLGGIEEENPYDLGLSDRKLVAIASILAMNTDVVVFDEPTIAQDYAAKEKIKAVIRRLREQGKMVLTIIHDMDFVAECFERVIVLCGGKVLLDGPTALVYAETDLLKQAYLEPPHVTQLCGSLGYSQVFLTVSAFVEHVKIQNRVLAK